MTAIKEQAAEVSCLSMSVFVKISEKYVLGAESG